MNLTSAASRYTAVGCTVPHYHAGRDTEPHFLPFGNNLMMRINVAPCSISSMYFMLSIQSVAEIRIHVFESFFTLLRDDIKKDNRILFDVKKCILSLEQIRFCLILSLLETEQRKSLLSISMSEKLIDYKRCVTTVINHEVDLEMENVKKCFKSILKEIKFCMTSLRNCFSGLFNKSKIKRNLI